MLLQQPLPNAMAIPSFQVVWHKRNHGEQTKNRTPSNLASLCQLGVRAMVEHASGSGPSATLASGRRWLPEDHFAQGAARKDELCEVSPPTNVESYPRAAEVPEVPRSGMELWHPSLQS